MNKSLWDDLPNHLQDKIVEMAWRQEVDDFVKQTENKYDIRFIYDSIYGVKSVEHIEQIDKKLDYHIIKELKELARVIFTRSGKSALVKTI